MVLTGILKIIGLVLLVITGAVLVVLLMVLFVPVRYSIKGRVNDDEKAARADAGWLFNMVKATAAYDMDGGLRVYLSLFGHRICDIVSPDGKDGTGEPEDLTGGGGDDNTADAAGAALEVSGTKGHGAGKPGTGEDVPDEDVTGENGAAGGGAGNGK